MNERRYQDLYVRRSGNAPAVAFHARRLEVAEISDEAWDSLTDNAHVLEELKAWSEAADLDAAPREKFRVRSLVLNVTQICNLHCTYCAAGGDGTYGDPVKKISVENTLPQLKFFLDQVRPGENFHIAFLGGEPLLYPETIRLVGEYVRGEAEKRKATASFKVTTNGTRVTDKALDVLANLRSHVVVSLDGPADVNDRQRVGKNGIGSFEAAFAGLRKLLAAKERLASVSVHSVFNERNVEVGRAWELFAPLAVDSMEFTFAVDRADLAASRAYDQALGRVLARAWEKGGEDELSRIANVRELFERLDSGERRFNHCGLGKSFLVVDARNQLWTCPWTIGRAEDKLGEGTDLDYDRIALHQRSQIETNGCGSCWARHLCGGGCSFIHSSTGGDLRDKRKDFCERTRFLAGEAVVYYHRARTAG